MNIRPRSVFGRARTLAEECHAWGVPKRPRAFVKSLFSPARFHIVPASPPALIAEYQTALPDKKLLQQKLHEFYQLALPATAAAKAKPQKR